MRGISQIVYIIALLIAPAGEFSKNVLDQTGLSFRLQGGVIFITKQLE